MQVNVRSEENKAIFQVAVLLSYPDMSLGPEDVGYIVEFEPVDETPQVRVEQPQQGECRTWVSAQWPLQIQ